MARRPHDEAISRLPTSHQLTLRTYQSIGSYSKSIYSNASAIGWRGSVCRERSHINASYEPSDTTLTICYEYLAYIQELGQEIPPAMVKENLTPTNYIVGPFLEVLLHEMAHAIFDLKKVPILGREEDAADQVSAFLLLRLGKAETRRVIASIAVMYASEARESPPKLKDFADEHGLPAQRLFNLMCISYGADPETFGGLIDKGYLPRARRTMRW